MLFIMIGYFEQRRKKEIKNWVFRLPWVEFVLTLFSSLLITSILIKTKIGKSLVG